MSEHEQRRRRRLAMGLLIVSALGLLGGLLAGSEGWRPG